MADWRDSVSDELPAFGLGDLDGDTLTVSFQGDGEMTDTKHGEAFKAHVTVDGTPTEYTDMAGDEVEEGEDYYLMSSSSRFLANLAEIGDDLTGATVEITGEGSGFDRTYSVTRA